MKTIDIGDVILVHRNITGLLGKRSTYETIERRFITILERRLSDFLVEHWRRGEIEIDKQGEIDKQEQIGTNQQTGTAGTVEGEI